MKVKKVYIGIVIAVLLGVLLMLLPAQVRTVKVLAPEALRLAQKEIENRVEPMVLADWIIQGRRDFVVVDIRGEQEFAKGSIKGAVNIPLEKLLLPGGFDELSRDKIIVLFGSGTGEAARVWLTLKNASVQAYVLPGGFAAWNKQVLNPVAPGAEATEEQVLAYKTQAAIQNYFLGNKDAVGALDSAITANRPKASAQKPVPKKKKLGGC